MISHSGAYSMLLRPGAVLGLGQEQIPQSRRFRLVFQLFDDCRRLPAIAFGDLVGEAFFVRIDLLVHERGQALLQILDAIGIFEIHYAAPASSVMVMTTLPDTRRSISARIASAPRSRESARRHAAAAVLP
jgi:hypothetical protein